MLHSCVNFVDDLRRKIFAKGRLEKMSSRSRQSELEGLMTEVIAQYRRLCAYREMTAISAGGNLDHISEVIASLATGVPGRGRKGKTETGLSGDLSDGTEVKSANRVQGQIDFIVRGRIEIEEEGSSNYVLHITNPQEDCPQLLNFDRLRRSLESQGAFCQKLVNDDNRLIGSELLIRTRTDSPIIFDGNLEQIRIKIRYHEELSRNIGCDHTWWVRRERSWFNFGKKTKSQLKALLSSKPLGVHFHMDPRGRITVAVFRFVPSKSQIQDFLDRIEHKWEVQDTFQFQPVLFVENDRINLQTRLTDGMYSFGAKLIMLGHQTNDHNFKVDFWSPNLGIKIENEKAKQMLTGFAKIDTCPGVSWENTNLPEWLLPNAETQERIANEFFQESICGYLRKIIPYCELTNHSFNIKFDETGEHLAAIVYGLRGTRTAARGGDLIENDGTESDVKVAAGWKGDALGTEDEPRYDLGVLGPQRSRKRAGLMRWRRWIPIRILAIEEDDNWKLAASVQALNSDHMREFHSILSRYQFATQLNVNCENRLYSPSISLGLRRKNDGLRTHNFLEAIRFIEGEEPRRGDGWTVATNEMEPCDCRFCQAQWVSNALPTN